MVAPQWGSFQKPNQMMESQQEEEFQQELPGEMQDQEKPEGEKPQWGNFQSPNTFQGEPDPTEDESGLDYILRNVVANASRLGEQYAGRYGNIEKFGKDILSNFPKTGGIIGWGLSELMGPEKWEQMVRGKPGQEQILPTSQQFKDASQKITGGYTKAKTKGEEKFQEFTEDVGSMLGGRRAPNLTGASRAQRASQFTISKLLIPAAANVTKQIVEGLGFGEDKANLAKAAIWTPLALANAVNAPQYASHLMNEGRRGLPATLQANIPRLTQRLDQVANSNHLLHSDPRSLPARQVLDGVRRDIANGQTNAQSLLTMYDGINAAKRNRGMFELGRNDQNFARKALDEVRNAVRDEITDVGANHPDALRNWQNGVQAWSVIHQSRAITNWVEDLAKGPYAKMLSGPAAALFGVGSYAGIKAPIIAGPLAAAVPSVYKIGQTIHRVWNDPRLANYYWNAVGAAANENLPTFASNYNKLNKELEKSETAKPKSKTKSNNRK